MEPRIEEFFPYMEDQPARRNRWAHLTEGLDKNRRIMTEVLLDNQCRQTMSRKRGAQMITEDTIMTTDMPTFTTFALPIIRRVFPNLIANQLLNTVPMNGPTGKVFYLDFVYAATTPNSPPTRPRIDQVANFDDRYAEAPEGQQVKQVGMKITDATIEVQNKKLKAEWSVESEQDAASQFGVDLPAEMSGVVADEIARETDRQLILNLFDAATDGVTWSSHVPATGPYALIDPLIYKKTLYEAIVDANAIIKRKRYRSANWIVGGTNACARLEKLEQFRLANTDGGNGQPRQIVSGPNLFGTLNNRWTVYEDPWLDDTLGSEQLLLGYKGQGAFDMAAVFTPYIGLMMTQPFTDPQTFTTVRSAMSRWGYKTLIPEAFATVTIV